MWHHEAPMVLSSTSNQPTTNSWWGVVGSNRPLHNDMIIMRRQSNSPERMTIPIRLVIPLSVKSKRLAAVDVEPIYRAVSGILVDWPSYWLGGAFVRTNGKITWDMALLLLLIQTSSNLSRTINWSAGLKCYYSSSLTLLRYSFFIVDTVYSMYKRYCTLLIYFTFYD